MDETKNLHFRVSSEDLEKINQKKNDAGIRSMSAYLRKMSIDGYCIRMDLDDVHETTRLLRICSNNLNQYAKIANETGSVYCDDIEDLKYRLNEIWENQKSLLARLSCIK